MDRHARTTRLALWVILLFQGVWFVIALVVVAQIFGVRVSLEPDPRKNRPVATSRGVAIAPATPAPVVVAEPRAKARAVPEPVIAPEPEPEPEPEVQPEPPAPRGSPVQRHIQDGWDHASNENLSAAAHSFQSAIQVEPDHPGANHGLGYVLIRQGHKDRARGPLCTARRNAGSDVELYREVDQLLRRNSLACN